MTPKPKWGCVRGLFTDSRYHRVYRDDKLGIQMEVLRGRRNGMPIGKPRRYFYIDGDEKEYRSEEALLAAIRENSLRMQSEENSA